MYCHCHADPMRACKMRVPERLKVSETREMYIVQDTKQVKCECKCEYCITFNRTFLRDSHHLRLYSHVLLGVNTLRPLIQVQLG